jgi:hypothetical protein
VQSTLSSLIQSFGQLSISALQGYSEALQFVKPEIMPATDLMQVPSGICLDEGSEKRSAKETFLVYKSMDPFI